MRIGAGLLLIAAGATLRFGLSTVSTHGVAIHTIGDILMLVGVLGVVLWLVVWAPWTRGRRPACRDEPPPDRGQPPPYREQPPDFREEPPDYRHPADRPYENEFRR